jgi:hypothetical protein
VGWVFGLRRGHGLSGGDRLLDRTDDLRDQYAAVDARPEFAAVDLFFGARHWVDPRPTNRKAQPALEASSSRWRTVSRDLRTAGRRIDGCKDELGFKLWSISTAILGGSEGHTAQSRGQRFNEAIAQTLQWWRIDASQAPPSVIRPTSSSTRRTTVW